MKLVHALICQTLLGILVVLTSLLCLAEEAQTQKGIASPQLENARQAMHQKQYDEARKIYIPLAGQANPEAMFALGQLYLNGWGVEKDHGKSSRWFRKAHQGWEEAAKSGNPMAFASLGLMYKLGLGVERNIEMERWYYGRAVRLAKKKSRRDDDANSQYLLALFYQSGRGVIRDKEKSKEWLLKAGENGHPRAQGLLTELYKYGCFNYPEDVQKAKYWRDKLAANKAPDKPQNTPIESCHDLPASLGSTALKRRHGPQYRY